MLTIILYVYFSTSVIQSQRHHAGTTIKVLGSHFTKDTSVSVYWDYTKTKTLEFTANVQNGSFVNSFPMPLAPTGIYTIAAVGQNSGVVVTASFHLLPNLYALPRATGAGSLFTLTGQAFGAGETVNIYWNCSGSCSGTPLVTATAIRMVHFKFLPAFLLLSLPLQPMGKHISPVSVRVVECLTPQKLLSISPHLPSPL